MINQLIDDALSLPQVIEGFLRCGDLHSIPYGVAVLTLDTTSFESVTENKYLADPS